MSTNDNEKDQIPEKEEKQSRELNFSDFSNTNLTNNNNYYYNYYNNGTSVMPINVTHTTTLIEEYETAQFSTPNQQIFHNSHNNSHNNNNNINSINSTLNPSPSQALLRQKFSTIMKEPRRQTQQVIGVNDLNKTNITNINEGESINYNKINTGIMRANMATFFFTLGSEGNLRHSPPLETILSSNKSEGADVDTSFIYKFSKKLEIEKETVVNNNSNSNNNNNIYSSNTNYMKHSGPIIVQEAEKLDLQTSRHYYTPSRGLYPIYNESNDQIHNTTRESLDIFPILTIGEREGGIQIINNNNNNNNMHDSISSLNNNIEYHVNSARNSKKINNEIGEVVNSVFKYEFMKLRNSVNNDIDSNDDEESDYLINNNNDEYPNDNSCCFRFCCCFPVFCKKRFVKLFGSNSDLNHPLNLDDHDFNNSNENDINTSSSSNTNITNNNNNIIRRQYSFQRRCTRCCCIRKCIRLYQFINVFSSQSKLPISSQILCLVNYISTILIISATILLFTTLFTINHTAIVNDGSVCQNYLIREVLTPDLSFSFICFIFNGILAVYFSLRAARYENAGLLICHFISILLQISHVMYFVFTVNSDYLTGGIEICIKVILITTIILMLISCLTYHWVYKSFGWRTFKKGITRSKILKTHRRYMYIQSCVQLDIFTIINACVAIIYMLDSQIEYIIGIVLGIISCLLILLFIPMLRIQASWFLGIFSIQTAIILAFYSYCISNVIDQYFIHNANKHYENSRCYNYILFKCLNNYNISVIPQTSESPNGCNIVNGSSTYLPSMGNQHELFEINNCNESCFNRRQYEIESYISNCCMKYGRCRLVDAVRSYNAIHLILLSLILTGVRIIIIQLWVRCTEEDMNNNNNNKHINNNNNNNNINIKIKRLGDNADIICETTSSMSSVNQSKPLITREINREIEK